MRRLITAVLLAGAAVMGLERGRGTDSFAGRYARFFMAGRSDFLIRFDPPATPSDAARAAN